MPSAVAFVGSFLYKWYDEVNLTYGKAMAFAALVWLVVPFLGSFPYVLTSELEFLDAYFESMSGFTTTGLTMFEMPGPGLIDASHTIFDSASAQGTVFLTSGITGPSMPAVLKVTYIIQMWIGRLEVIPVVALFAHFIGVTPRHHDPF